MKKVILVKGLLVLVAFVYLQSLSSCFKEQVNLQVELQEILISAPETGKCWALTRRIDSSTIKYYRNKYMFDTKTEYVDGNVIFYYEKATPFYKYLLTSDSRGLRSIDNNISDCTQSEDILEPNHLFFRMSDYPDLNRIEHQSYDDFSNIHRTKISSAHNPSIRDTSFYYYEELYFERNGRFRKKIFLDEGCNAIEITGNWKFRTPFANSYKNDNNETILKTDIILEYDLAPLTGVRAKHDVYQISAFENFQILNIKQVNVETDTRILDIQKHYTLDYDKIYPARHSDEVGHSLESGRVINHWTNSCGLYDNAKGNDKIEIIDEFELERQNITVLSSDYNLKDIRCVNPVNTSCPKFCGLDICGNFTASVYDDDDFGLISTHKSDITVAADSSIITINNFANTGHPIQVTTQEHQWGACYFYDGFTTVLGGTNIQLVGIRKRNFKGTDMIYVECRINGTSRLIHYQL